MIFASTIGILASIAVTVLLYLKVIPAKFDKTFTKKPLQFLHNYFNFKNLYLETILKAIFTLLSIACVTLGLLGATIGNIIQFFTNIVDSVNYGYFGSWVWEQLFGFFFGGIALALLGPLVLRLAYEVILMFILLVKNVIEINKKLGKNETEPENEAPADAIVEVEAEIITPDEVENTEEAPPSEEASEE